MAANLGMTCSICLSAQRSRIDAMMTGNQPLSHIAKQYGVSYAALRRHKANHLGNAMPPAPAPVTIAAGSTPLEVLRGTVDALAAVDLAKLTPAQLGKHAENVRRAAESLARMEPPREPDAWRVRDVEGMDDFLADMLDALDPHPAALAALKPVIAKHMGPEGA